MTDLFSVYKNIQSTYYPRKKIKRGKFLNAAKKFSDSVLSNPIKKSELGRI